MFSVVGLLGEVVAGTAAIYGGKRVYDGAVGDEEEIVPVQRLSRSQKRQLQHAMFHG